MNSRNKGKRGELEWRDQLRQAGFTTARRGRQYSGDPSAPDVICEELESFHFEVKRVERLQINDAMDQAKHDAGNLIPVVPHRRNNCQWLVTMTAEDWFHLVREAGL